MAILEINSNYKESEAADGRFLLPDELSDELSGELCGQRCAGQNCSSASEKFWLKYWDVLPEGIGIIYQQAETSNLIQK
ncbi:MAG: hypothetical protein ACREGF_03410, partial [Candidatus Saccharimonadales bacterium]